MTAVVNNVYPVFEIYAEGDDRWYDRRRTDGQLWQRVAEGNRRD